MKKLAILIFLQLLMTIVLFCMLNNVQQEFDITQFKPTTPRVRELYPGGFFPESAAKCTSEKDMLILVFSAPANRESRDGIRKNWGSEAKNLTRLLFLVGGADLSYSFILSMQNENGGDVIIGNFVDSYRNLTLKSVAMLEWTRDNCPNSSFLLKSDDDVYINLPMLVRNLKKKVKVDSKTLVGHLNHAFAPERNPSSKNFLSWSDFPSKILPDFLTGPAYAMTGQLVGPLFEAALQEHWLYLEDVFLTGLVAPYKVGAQLRDWPGFLNEKVHMSPCNAKTISIHQVTSSMQAELMILRDEPCFIIQRNTWTYYG